MDKKLIKKHVVIAMSFLLFLTISHLGCATDENGTYSESVNPVQAKQENKVQAIGDRRFHAGDIVILRVMPGKEFEKELELTVNLQGEILVPLLGWVKIEGLLEKEAEDNIRAALNKDFIVNPRVSVRIKEAKSRAVVLLGELKKPGTYEFPPSGKMTLLEAVAKAEGFTDIANLEKIKVVRNRPDGSQQSILVNAKKIFEGKESDPELQEGDLVSVPETLF